MSCIRVPDASKCGRVLSPADPSSPLCSSYLIPCGEQGEVSLCVDCGPASFICITLGVCVHVLIKDLLLFFCKHCLFLSRFHWHFLPTCSLAAPVLGTLWLPSHRNIRDTGITLKPSFQRRRLRLREGQSFSYRHASIG